ncbi:hypothetical protein EV363DRAFT_1317135 [Boletus edulis]|uniref:Uncharacterized protein n=1 Tax=Boletus edulis BED1 TaxID=1328754 RepID=A0AAD4BT87_BOLED|nr:hypothetical protein EV363DRAFT_1317135 [Boletus edulis]KAF8438980.1 hypothetical protein L210DRAFT_3542907 [Boletus edulis BED1]
MARGRADGTVKYLVKRWVRADLHLATIHLLLIPFYLAHLAQGTSTKITSLTSFWKGPFWPWRGWSRWPLEYGRVLVVE